MTQLAASIFQPAPARITSISRNPLSGGFQEVLRIKGSSLPGNGDYQFIVFGRLGDVTMNSDQPFLFADVMLGNGAGGFFTSARHVVALQDFHIRRDVYAATQPQHGFPFMLLLKVAGWTTGDDLVLYARIYDETTFPPLEISYSVGQVGILAWNLTAIGSSHYIAEETSLVSTALNLKGAGSQVLHTTSILPWTSGAEDWAFFWSARVRAMEPTNRFGIYIEGWDTATLWDWGDDFPNSPYGGAFLRGPLNPAVADIAGYSLGSFVHEQVTTGAVSLRLRGRCNYDVGTQAVFRQGRLFGIRLSKLHEWAASKGDGGTLKLANDWYGEHFVPRGRVDEHGFQVPHANAIWLSSAVPTYEHNRAPEDPDVNIYRIGFHTRLKHNETKELNAPECLFVNPAVIPLEGLYEIAGGKVDLHDGLNFFDHETTRRPIDSVSSLHFLQSSFKVLGGPFKTNDLLVGQASGASCRNYEPRMTPNPPSIRYDARTRDENAGNFDPGETVRTPEFDPLFPTEFVLRTSPHPQDEPEPYTAMFRQFLCLSVLDAAPAISAPDQVSGPDVEYIPGREGPSLASLNTLPWGVSAPVRFELVGDRVSLKPRAGYQISWPRFTTIRRRAVFPFHGLTIGQRDALIDWAAMQSVAAFKHADLDDIERAYVIDVDEEGRPRIECNDRGVLHDVEIHALELRWLT